MNTYTKLLMFLLMNVHVGMYSTFTKEKIKEEYGARLSSEKVASTIVKRISERSDCQKENAFFRDLLQLQILHKEDTQETKNQLKRIRMKLNRINKQDKDLQKLYFLPYNS